MSSKDSIASNDFRVQIGSTNTEERIYEGLVVHVDPIKNTMSVNVAQGMGTRLNPIERITINNPVTNFGMGIRMLPIAGITTVLLYRVNANKWYHIGYATKGMEDYVSDKTCSKEENNLSGRLLQRFIDQGEIILSNIGGAEVYLSADGSILLSTDIDTFLKLDTDFARLNGSFANMQFEMDGTRIRSGNTIRHLDKNTHDDIYIFDLDGAIKKEYEILDTDAPTLINEFTVQVGTVPNTSTGFDDPDFEETGFLSIADRVINEQGNEEKVLDKSLNYLLKFPVFETSTGTSTGLSMSVNSDSEFVVLDRTNDNYIKFSSGNKIEGTTSTGLTNIEIKLSKTKLTLNGAGELSYTMVSPGETNKKTVTITATSTGNITILTSSGITIKSGSASIEATALGETLQTLLNTFITNMSTHTHGTGTGPTTPPNDASYAPLAPYFQSVLLPSGTLKNIISKQVKNN